MNKANKEQLLKKAKDYLIVTVISHGIGLAVFTPYNVVVLNFTIDQLIRNAIASTGSCMELFRLQTNCHMH